MADEEIYLGGSNGVLGPVTKGEMQHMVDLGLVERTERDGDVFYKLTALGKRGVKLMEERLR